MAALDACAAGLARRSPDRLRRACPSLRRYLTRERAIRGSKSAPPRCPDARTMERRQQGELGRSLRKRVVIALTGCSCSVTVNCGVPDFAMGGPRASLAPGILLSGAINEEIS